MIKCLYHNDPDGRCAAFWVKNHCDKGKIPYTKSDFYEVNYDMEIPFTSAWKGDTIYIVDFSVDPELMREMQSVCNVIWIDHHKTAIDKYQDYPGNIAGVRNLNHSGCMLTWLYFNGLITQENMDLSAMKAPLFTQLVDKWDTWNWKDNAAVEPFITYLQSVDHGPLSLLWKQMMEYDGGVLNAVTKGEQMIMFRDGYGKTLCESIGSHIVFNGYRCFACNAPKSNSEWFKSVCPESYDILMPFYYNLKTRRYCVSLYSDRVDVSKIAVKYGGGGHCGAAGFDVDHLPW